MVVGVSHSLPLTLAGVVVPGVGAVLPASPDGLGNPSAGRLFGRLWLGSAGFLVDDCGIRDFRRLTQVLPQARVF